MPATVTLMLALVGAAPAEGDLRVWLEGQRGTLSVDDGAPVLTLQVLAHSRLPVAVEAVQVGLLFAKSEETLALVDAAAAYQPTPGVKATRDNAVGAVQAWRDCTLAPNGEAVLSVEATIGPTDPEPVVYVTHVLGFRLADLQVPLLVELLRSEVPADEVAVVESLALTGSDAAKAAARARWGSRADLRQGLAELTSAPLPAQPTIADALVRVMAVRALGVLGGSEASAALARLQTAPVSPALDERIVELGIARARGSRLETPLAFAVPAEAQGMADVVAAAQAELAAGPAAPVATPPAMTVAPAPDLAAAETPAPTAGADPSGRGPTWPWLGGAVVVLLLGVLAMRRRGSSSG
jgi:hypothetical protein